MLLYILGVLVIFVGIAASIALHEIGHLIPAKLFKVRVTQYMVGFGPTLWSRKRGETEYGFKAIPLGGYIRMIGMFPPRAKDGGKLRASSSNPMHLMIEQAREESLEEVTPEDQDRVFYRLPVWKRIIIMSGGPLMNLALAAGLMTLFLTAHGIPSTNPTISNVSVCANVDVSNEDCTGQPPSPAAAAGFEVGDTIVSVDGTAVDDWLATTYAIQNAGEDATFVVDRDGTQETLNAELVLRENTLIGPDGAALALDEEGDPITGMVGFLGARPTQVMEKQSLAAVPPVVSEMFTGTARIVITLPQRLIDVSQAAFGSEERDQNGPMSVVGVGRVAGEVTQDGLGGVIESMSDRMWLLVNLIASLNMALFVFNLIPLLPLDGGHIAGALWEGMKKTWARAFGKPEPGPVDTAAALPIAYVVAIGLLGMTALLIYADIVRPVQFG